MNKILIIVLVLAVVVLGGYFLLKGEEAQAPTEETSETITTEEENAGTPALTEETVIVYTDSGYSPDSLTIKVGTTVLFKNDSSLSMWPASAMHPTHAVYPTTGGCLGSTFDACKGVLPGESWSFKFDIAGSWKYHDHLHPNLFGAIVVE